MVRFTNRCSSLESDPLTSPVQAAIAELTNVAQTGNGLAAGEFAGGDMLLDSQVCRSSAHARVRAGFSSRPEAVKSLAGYEPVSTGGKMTHEVDSRRSDLLPGRMHCVDLACRLTDFS